MSGNKPRAKSPPRSVPCPVDTSAPPADTVASNGMVESPSISSPNALARFEYESGRTKDCTKVLMVEWEDDETTRDIKGEWEVSWENKRTVLAARDTPDRGINRLYFLLTAGERVPGAVRLTLTPDATDAGVSPVVWKANPLPAIFPPELGASAREAGKKGVLHTIWAKRRLQVLSDEIAHESQENVEGVALVMALREKEWIEENFGVQARPTAKHREALKAVGEGISARSPSSPRSPETGRLMDKLRGLKLNTATVERQADDIDEPDFSDNLNPLSPEQTDVAVSSFGSFAALKGIPDPQTLAAKPPQNPGPPVHRVTSQRPPTEIVAQQRQGGYPSLNALATGGQVDFAHESHDDDRDDDLFALPMSPRSPDTARSPFSFGGPDARGSVGAG